MYHLLFISSSEGETKIPFTRKLSYSQFCESNRKINLQSYILKLLELYPDGLTCRQISDLSGVWVQSLTNPLKSLVDSGQLHIPGIRRSSVSNRYVQVYSLPTLKNI